MEAMDKVESIQRRAPFIPRILERRDAFIVLLLICCVLLAGNGYEFLEKELPDISAPKFACAAPPAPIITGTAAPRIVYKDRPVPANPGDAAELEKLRQNADQREQRKKQRSDIAMLMREGLQIQQDCLTTNPNPDLVKRSDEWGKKVYHYLLTIDPSYAVRFDGANGLSYSHDNVPSVNDNIWNRMNHRYDVLGEITKELHD
jgi:hypothetical protein